MWSALPDEERRKKPFSILYKNIYSVSYNIFDYCERKCGWKSDLACWWMSLQILMPFVCSLSIHQMCGISTNVNITNKNYVRICISAKKFAESKMGQIKFKHCLLNICIRIRFKKLICFYFRINCLDKSDADRLKRYFCKRCISVVLCSGANSCYSWNQINIFCFFFVHFSHTFEI